MTWLILFVLAGAWGWFGYVTWRDRRAQATTRTGSMSSFSDQLSVLGRTSPATRRPAVRTSPIRPPAEADGPSVRRLRMLALGEPIDAAETPVVGLDGRTLPLSEAQRRRRLLTFGLGGAALLFIILAIAVGGLFTQLAVVVTAMALAYLGLLARARQVEIERAIKVRRLLPRPEVPSIDQFVGSSEGNDEDGTGYPVAYGSGYAN